MTTVPAADRCACATTSARHRQHGAGPAAVLPGATDVQPATMRSSNDEHVAIVSAQRHHHVYRAARLSRYIVVLLCGKSRKPRLARSGKVIVDS